MDSRCPNHAATDAHALISHPDEPKNHFYPIFFLLVFARPSRLPWSVPTANDVIYRSGRHGC